jgi:hypothetical protein
VERVVTLKIRPCGGPVEPASGCPNAANHQPHPSGYVACSNWADDSLLVATQKRCLGCGGLELWVPKRPDLRLAVFSVERRLVFCGWGRYSDGATCGAEAVAERLSGEAWVAVCADHTGVGR